MVPEWPMRGRKADVPRKCWHQTKISENNIFGVFSYCLNSKEPQNKNFKSSPDVQDCA
jgi:hypothetical protein